MSNVGSSLIALVPTILALGITVALVKSFQGKDFDFDSAHRTKAAANKKATQLRKRDFKTRVVKESENSKSLWVVYKRDESGFSFF